MNKPLPVKTTTLLFLRRDNQILLAMKRRGHGVGYWNGVGGKVEPGETIEQAAARECREEIGVTPTHLRKVVEHDFILYDGDAPYRMNCHGFLCDTWEGEPVETEEMTPQWFNITDIPYDHMWQDDPYWLPLVLDGKLIKTYFTFDKQNNMLTQDIKEVEKL